MKKIYLTLFAISFLTYANAQTTPRLPLIEGLTSNTCAPCATWNGSYGPIIENNNPNDPYNPGVAVVKYQMDWPGPGTDPSFNADADSRRSFYGTTGIPDWYLDGQSQNGTQSEITAAQNNPAQLKISAAYTLTGTTIDVTVQIIPLVALGNGNRCYIALTNKTYNYSGGTNGESNFKHVVRKMLPAGGGSFLPNLIANDTFYINQSYTYNVASGVPAQNSFDLWNPTFELVAWVQKPNGTKPVYNATIAPEGALGIEEGDNDDFGLIVYPNPSTIDATILFDANVANDSRITIYNQIGESVFEESYGNLNGNQRITINTSDFANGMYFIQVVNGDKIATQQLLITK